MVSKKICYSFMIRETQTMNVKVEADSFQEALSAVEEMYEEGEYNLDHNCFAGVEFRPVCTHCESDFDDEDELYEIEPGIMLCDRCISEIGG